MSDLQTVYIKNSLIPARYVGEIALHPAKRDEGTFEELQQVLENIRLFVKDGKNLLICSNNVGNGKTTWATKLLKAYINEVSNLSFTDDTPVLFINVNNFLNEKKLAIGDKQLAERVNRIERCILSAKLVVFDDIADRSLSEYDMNNLYYWLDYRTSNLKSCIFTSNQLPSELQRTLSGKVYSRVVNYSEIKTITGGDSRKA